MIPIPPGEIGQAICEKYISSEKWEEDFRQRSSELHRISKYTGLNFNEVKELPLRDYLQYRRDSWIESWSRSEEGRDFLKTLWRLQQTKADEKAIREFNERRK